MLSMLIIQSYKYWCFKLPEDCGSLSQPTGNKMRWQEVTNRCVGHKMQCTMVTNTIFLNHLRTRKACAICGKPNALSGDYK